MSGEQWYIDKNGTVIIPLKYEDAEPFFEGLAAVRIRGKWGYIDKNDNLVIAAIFTEAFAFSEGLAVVFDNPFRQRHVSSSARSLPSGLSHISTRDLINAILEVDFVDTTVTCHEYSYPDL